MLIYIYISEDSPRVVHGLNMSANLTYNWGNHEKIISLLSVMVSKRQDYTLKGLFANRL